MLPALTSTVLSGIADGVTSMVEAVQGWLPFSAAEKAPQKASQAESDRALIERINSIIYDKMAALPSYLEKDFAGDPPVGVEREAVHSRWVRVFIYNSQLPRETGEFIQTLSEDQRRVGLAYLSSIDQGGIVASTKYKGYQERVAVFARDFIAKADEDEKKFYAEKRLPVSETLVEGNRTRPFDKGAKIPLGPKFHRHPITALMLAEFRRDLFPAAQEKVDGHFHSFNMQSRPGEIVKMRAGEKSVVQTETATVTSFVKTVQIEFYPNRKSTDAPSYLTSIQGEGTLTTHGQVNQYDFANGKTLYLIKYEDYKDSSVREKYLVSSTIPIGAPGETYEASLTLEAAQARIQELAQK